MNRSIYENGFLDVAERGAQGGWTILQFVQALREAFPTRYREGKVFYTEQDLDDLLDAVQAIASPSTTFHTAYAVELVCGAMPHVVWSRMHPMFALAWLERAKAGDPAGFDLYELHSRATDGGDVTLREIWNLCPWC